MFWQRLQGRAIALAATGVGLATAGYLIYDAIRNQITRPSAQATYFEEKSSHATQQSRPVSETPQTILKRKAIDMMGETERRHVKRVRSEPISLAAKLTNISSPELFFMRELHFPRQSDSSASTVMTAISSVRSDNPAEGNTDSEYDELENFREVIDSIDFEKLKTVALRVRKENQQSLRLSARDEYVLPEDLSCDIYPDPHHGTFNLVYTIHFSDELRWIARIPGHGSCFENLDKAKIASEYQTMKLIKDKTTIPIPETYHLNLDASEIGSAFALMEFKDGLPLDHLWNTTLTEHGRLKVLNETAKYMSQLQKLRYEECGILDFSKQGTQPTIRPHIYFSASHTENGDLPWGESYEDRPYETYADQLRGGWDNCHGFTKRAKSAMPILDLAVKSIPDHLDSACTKALYMPDLNLHNMLVDKNANIVAFLDWDMVSITPTAAGCAKYPPWILQDWVAPLQFLCDNQTYGEDKGGNEEKLRKAKEQMFKHRSYYAACYARWACLQVDDYDPRTTRSSHLLGAIESAVTHRFSRRKIVSMLLEHAFEGKPPFTLVEYGDAFEADNTREYDTMLEEAFAAMWQID